MIEDSKQLDPKVYREYKNILEEVYNKGATVAQLHNRRIDEIYRSIMTLRKSKPSIAFKIAPSSFYLAVFFLCQHFLIKFIF